MRGNPSRRRDWPVEVADWVVERTICIISSSGTSRPSLIYGSSAYISVFVLFCCCSTDGRMRSEKNERRK